MSRKAFTFAGATAPKVPKLTYHREGSKKQPYRFASADGLFPIAAVWNQWEQDGKNA